MIEDFGSYRDERDSIDDRDDDLARLDPDVAEAEAHAAGVRTDFSDFAPAWRGPVSSGGTTKRKWGELERNPQTHPPGDDLPEAA